MARKLPSARRSRPVIGAPSLPTAKALAETHKLKARIAQSPEDDALRLVYADLLQQEGDEQGELILLQSTLLAEPTRPGVVEREQVLRSRVAGAQVRTMERGGVEVGWHLGFIDSFCLTSKAARRGASGRRTLDGFVQALLLHPCSMLRRVDVDDDPRFEHMQIFDLMIAHAPPLRRLRLGCKRHPFARDLATLSCFRLRELSLAGADLRLERLDQDLLSSLSVRTRFMQLDGLLCAKLPRLESLSLAVSGRPLVSSGLTPILAGRQFPNLKHLALDVRNCAAILPLVLQSSLFPQLVELGTDDSDATKNALLRHKGALAHVRLSAGADWSFEKLHS